MMRPSAGAHFQRWLMIASGRHSSSSSWQCLCRPRSSPPLLLIGTATHHPFSTGPSNISDVKSIAKKAFQAKRRKQASTTAQPSSSRQPKRMRQAPSRKNDNNLATMSDQWESVDTRALAAHTAQYMRLKAFVEELSAHMKQKNSPSSSSSSSSSSAAADPKNVRETLQYFISWKAAGYCSKQNMPEIPDQCTKLILNYLDFQYFNRKEQDRDIRWIQAAVANSHNGPCGALVATMQHFLEPFKGTAYSMRNFGHRRRRREDIHQSEFVEALQQATRVKHMIMQLIQDPKCSDVLGDAPALPMCLAFLELWNCRSWYLGRYSTVNLDPSTCQSALEDATHSRECVDAIMQYLEEMEQEHRGLPKPDDNAYSIYINALAVSGYGGTADRAHKVLTELEKENRETTHGMYNSTLLAYSNEAKLDPTVVKGAKELFHHMLSNTTKIKPDSVTIATLLNVYSNARMPQEVEQLLLDFEQNYNTLGIPRPTRIDYNTAINSWAKSLEPGGAERAFALFQRMLHLSNSNPEVSPDRITYTILINAFARNPNTGKEGLEQAETLLDHVESGEDPSVTPDATMYRTYMSALSVRISKQKKDFAKDDIAYRIELLQRRMKAQSTKVPPSMANFWHATSNYNTALAAWAKSRSPRAIERAVLLYKDLVKEYETSGKNPALQPDFDTYVALLTCLGMRQNAGDKRGVGPEAVSLAKNVLHEMETKRLMLTIGTINLYLKVLSTSGIPATVMEAEKLLQSLEEDYAAGHSNIIPNDYSYEYVMDGYAKTRGGAEHAERLLNQMISLSEKHATRRKRNISPSNGCFNIVMDAWSRSGREDAVENVVRIMYRLENYGLQPDTYAYTTLISAYARDDHKKDAPERAEAILAKMQSDHQSGKNPNCRPNAASFASVIKCWERSHREESPERIEAIVRRMKELSAHTEYRHLTLNYNSLRFAIMAWLHSTDRRPEAGEKAVALLDLVDEILYSGRLEAHHALHCYNSVIVTAARSLDSDKAPKAYNILKRIEQQSLKPRARDYRAVLSACSQTASTESVSDLQKQEAFRLANITFLEYLESGLQADVDVYKEMIGLHTTLMIGNDKEEENREKLVSAIFSNAPPTIQQSEGIQSALRAALSREAYHSLLKKLQ